MHLKKIHNKEELMVANQGDTLPKEDREKIFARFYRSGYARNEEENHYGLGHTIAKNIVQIHKVKFIWSAITVGHNSILRYKRNYTVLT